MTTEISSSSNVKFRRGQGFGRVCRFRSSGMTESTKSTDSLGNQQTLITRISVHLATHFS